MRSLLKLLCGVSWCVLVNGVVSEARAQQTNLPPVTVDAPQSQRSRPAATAPSRRASTGRTVRRNAAAQATRGAPQPAAAATVGGVERADGPVNGYVASRSASSTKTDTPIIETPQSISVVSREQIRDQNGASIGDILRYVPGVQIQASSFARTSDNIGIRGFDVSSGNGGLLRDGLKLNAGVYDTTTEPYGLERVEVIKGASSILYGQLGPGGLVNFISKKPLDAPFGEINVSAGSYQRKEISGDVSGPVTKDGSLLYRFTGLWRDGDAPMQYTPDGKLYLAPSLTWRPDASTSLTLLGYYQKVDTRFATPLPEIGTVKPTIVGRIPAQNFLGEPAFDKFKNEAGTVGYQFEHAFNNAVKIRQNFRYYTAQTDWDYLLLTGIAADGRTGTRSVSSRIEKGEGIAVDSSVEAKLGLGPAVHTVIAGIDYYRSVLDSTRYQGTVAPIDVFNPVYGSPVVVNRSVNRGSVSTGDQLGFYAQDQIKLYDKFVLLIGGRRDLSSIDTLISRTNASSTQVDDAWTGRVGGVYLTDIGLAPYASYSQSFQPVLGTDRLNNPYLPSRGEQVEAGVRYQVPGSRMLISAAAFEIKQTNVQTPDLLDLTYSVQIGEVTSRGIELEAKTEFGPLALIASYAYTDVRTTKSTTQAAIGERLAFTPYNAASIWGIYDFGSIGWHGFKFGGGVRYVGDTNLPGVAFNVPDYTVADLVAIYDLKYLARELNGFQARLNVKNLFNNGYVVCVSSGGCRYGDPQTVIGTLSYRW